MGMRDPDQIMDDFITTGEMPTEQEVMSLCAIGMRVMLVEEQLVAFTEALENAGWGIVDLTTDDGVMYELVPPKVDPVPPKVDPIPPKVDVVGVFPFCALCGNPIAKGASISNVSYRYMERFSWHPECYHDDKIAGMCVEWEKRRSMIQARGVGRIGTIEAVEE